MGTQEEIGNGEIMTTKIEWCDETWNPITGCTHISEGCQNCYAEKMAKRLAGRYGYPKDKPFQPGTFHENQLVKPFKWKKPRRIFTVSMGDLFHKDVKVSQLNRVFNVISRSWELALEHKFLILTKRPSKMKKYIQEHRDCETAVCYYETSNVWLGVTAENQKTADERIPILMQIPAAIRFVSVEPMLDQIYFDGQNECVDYYFPFENEQGTITPGIDWVICGAETGQKARRMAPEWAYELYQQCKDAGVPFFFKKPSKGDTIDLPREFPNQT